MYDLSFSSELINQLTLLVEQRIQYKNEEIDTELVIETLKEVFPNNHSDVEATIQSFLGSNIEITRKPDRIISQASCEARKYLIGNKENIFLFPRSTYGLELHVESNIEYRPLKKYKKIQNLDSNFDDQCVSSGAFTIGRQQSRKSYILLLEAERKYDDEAPIIFNVISKDGLNIGKHLAERMMILWHSCKFEVRVTY